MAAEIEGIHVMDPAEGSGGILSLLHTQGGGYDRIGTQGRVFGRSGGTPYRMGPYRLPNAERWWWLPEGVA